MVNTLLGLNTDELRALVQRNSEPGFGPNAKQGSTGYDYQDKDEIKDRGEHRGQCGQNNESYRNSHALIVSVSRIHIN